MSGAPKKKWLMVTAVLVVMIVIAGCIAVYLAVFYKDGKTVKDYDLTPKEVTSKIISDLKITDITEVKQNQLIKHYNIQEGLIQDFSIYMSTSANKSFEIACFELKDKNQFEDLEQVIAEHVATKAQGFKELSPAEYDLIQSYRVVHKGRFVLLIISENASAIEKDFFSIFT